MSRDRTDWLHRYAAPVFTEAELSEIAKRAMLPVPVVEWQWFGQSGHYILGYQCRFHLATRVGPWLVSTVGERVVTPGPGYKPWPRPKDMPQAAYEWLSETGCVPIGLEHYYETMVFAAGDAYCSEENCHACGIPIPAAFSPLERAIYNVSGDASRGHMAMCLKWAAIPIDSPLAKGD